MPCYHPIKAWRSPRCVHPKSGKPVMFFKEYKVKPYDRYEELEVQCNQCIGCRLERSRQWAARCLMESKLYDHNCFVTLTYSDEALKKLKNKGTLVKEDFKNFVKRLRQHVLRNRDFRKQCRKKFKKDFGKIRYYHCGEYGTICKTCGKSRIYCEKDGCGKGKFIPSLGRPHYHACFFNLDFPDKEIAPIRRRKDEPILYVSKHLQKIWKYGYSTVGLVNFESAAYCARYITKKITGKEGWTDKKGVYHVSAKEHYGDKEPEYTTMSRKPGLAREWYNQFKGDVYPQDSVVLRGKLMKPPKYFDRCFADERPDDFVRLQQRRKEKAEKNADDNTPARLAVKEEIKMSQYKQLKRSLEDENV